MLLHQDADYADDPGSDAEQPAASMPASWAALAIFEDEDVSAAANAAASSAASASASNAAIVTAATVATAAKQESVVFQASDGVLVDADAIAEATESRLIRDFENNNENVDDAEEATIRAMLAGIKARSGYLQEI